MTGIWGFCNTKNVPHWSENEISDSIYDYYAVRLDGRNHRKHRSVANRRQYIWTDIAVCCAVDKNYQTEMGRRYRDRVAQYNGTVLYWSSGCDS